MPDTIWIIRTERRTGAHKRRSVWVMQDFFTEEEHAKEQFIYYKRILHFGVRLYECKLIEDHQV